MKHRSSPPGRRPRRVAEQVRQVVTAFLTEDARDPRIGLVTVTNVEITRDLSRATVSYVVHGDEAQREKSQEGLDAAAVACRRRLGAELQLRVVPEVVFTLDVGSEHMAHIARLLAGLDRPEESPVLSDGILLVDKPAGPTSHDVVGAVRRALGIRRVGHAGTLDPPATGLLVVLVGRATRLARFVSLLPKRYAGTIRLGSETTTDDAAGEMVGASDDSWQARLPPEIDAALRNVQARPEQLPPAVSAKKVDGVRAYRVARRGGTPAVKPARVTIDRLRCEWYDRKSGEIHVDVVCSSGTYVRSIARDVGRELASKAHLSSLRRTEIGNWKVDQAVGLDGLEPAELSQRLLPMREAVSHLPAVILPADEARRFTLGQKIPAAAPMGAVAVFDAADLLGVAEQSDGVLHPEVVLIG